LRFLVLVSGAIAVDLKVVLKFGAVLEYGVKLELRTFFLAAGGQLGG